MTAPHRISFYRQQMRAGNVQLLCSTCNALKGDMSPDRWWAIVKFATYHALLHEKAGSPGGGPPFTMHQIRERIRMAVTQ
jgi:hypothetical protein